MHTRVKQIFEEHDAWLQRGGDHGIPGVQRANLAEIINKHLEMAELTIVGRLTRIAHARGKRAEFGEMVGELKLRPTSWEQETDQQPGETQQPERPQAVDGRRQENDQGGTEKKHQEEQED